MNYKVLKFIQKPPLSRAKKHHNFQVTGYQNFDTIDVDFAYSKSVTISIFCENLIILKF
jgi:hypothetical protein